MPGRTKSEIFSAWRESAVAHPPGAPSGCSFTLKGIGLLAAKLSRKGISYEIGENTFLKIGDWVKAQSLSDSTISITICNGRYAKYVPYWCRDAPLNNENTAVQLLHFFLVQILGGGLEVLNFHS
jgi:hypothetical protein